jgi:hypothetical protein
VLLEVGYTESEIDDLLEAGAANNFIMKR